MSSALDNYPLSAWLKHLDRDYAEVEAGARRQDLYDALSHLVAGALKVIELELKEANQLPAHDGARRIFAERSKEHWEALRRLLLDAYQQDNALAMKAVLVMYRACVSYTESRQFVETAPLLAMRMNQEAVLIIANEKSRTKRSISDEAIIERCRELRQEDTGKYGTPKASGIVTTIRKEFDVGQSKAERLERISRTASVGC